jgi:uridine kinase
MTLDDLAARVSELDAAAKRPRVLIGIAGAPGAGKTTLADALVARLGGFPAAVHVPMDGFHLANVELARLGRTARKGAPDTFDPLGYAALLGRIAAGETVWAPGFERVLEQPIAQTIPVTAETRVVVSEGNYLLLDEPEWAAVRAWFDEVWFCMQEEAVRLDRLIAHGSCAAIRPTPSSSWLLRSTPTRSSIFVFSILNRTDPDNSCQRWKGSFRPCSEIEAPGIDAFSRSMPHCAPPRDPKRSLRDTMWRACYSCDCVPGQRNWP